MYIFQGNQRDFVLEKINAKLGAVQPWNWMIFMSLNQFCKYLVWMSNVQQLSKHISTSRDALGTCSTQEIESLLLTQQ